MFCCNYWLKVIGEQKKIKNSSKSVEKKKRERNNIQNEKINLEIIYFIYTLRTQLKIEKVRFFSSCFLNHVYVFDRKIINLNNIT